MLKEVEIKAKYKKLHDELTEGYYSGASGWTKEEFDTLHGKIWVDMEAELIASGYRTLPTPIDEAEQATCEEYLTHSSDAITQPEIWYLLRAFGKKLGYKVD